MAEEEWERIVRRPEDACGACGRRFGPGDEVVTSLALEGGSLARTDHCAPCFAGRAPEPFSFWRFRRPADGAAKPRRLDFNYLAEFFRRLERRDDETSKRLLWLVALLLLRRRVLQERERRIEEGREVLVVGFRGDERTFTVRDPGIDAAAMASLHEDLARIFNLEGAEPDARPA